MQGSKQFKRAILKNLLLGLRKSGVASRSRNMSFHEKKIAVRHAADAALATARGTAPCWSRSLAAELLHGLDARRTAAAECSSWPRKTTCKSILRRQRRSFIRARPKSKATANAAGILARAMVRRRTRALREVVPGGRGMDECTLLGETLDYAVSLKAQVEAMQLLLRTLKAPNNPA
ncbi:hypothetical protein PR202_ga03014 [Eleusine coracana subsp. coracana]|uniref:IBH1-like N-terminal domain-containing protein n=1 Tax=Eleusine coracana subsp. coracana TaxID=191504 RepID=A0AAV5BMY6_ELECO|nr:hypothetical protein QOZ80_2AG0148600 [Eleusine coracana subsp. coracana]GJM87094.1 hypothetical protein PR202_ga03014 [Eleusine coracana subsp. coracana]